MIYLIGSLRNPEVPKIANQLRSAGLNVFDDWYAAGEIADDSWRDYEKARGRTYMEALQGAAAKNVFAFDKRHLDAASDVILVLPAGKSGHLELGWAIGKGKRGYILLDSPDRWDVMYQFADLVTDKLEDIVADIQKDRTIFYNACDICKKPIRFGEACTSFTATGYAHMECYRNCPKYTTNTTEMPQQMPFTWDDQPSGGTPSPILRPKEPEGSLVGKLRLNHTENGLQGNMTWWKLQNET